MGLQPNWTDELRELRCAVSETESVFGSDCGPIPYGIKEHVQIVEDVLNRARLSANRCSGATKPTEYCRPGPSRIPISSHAHAFHQCCRPVA